MSAFFWAGDHIGWAFFSLLVFSVVWLVLADLVWRLKDTSRKQFVIGSGLGWLLGLALVVLASITLN